MTHAGPGDLHQSGQPGGAEIMVVLVLRLFRSARPVTVRGQSRRFVRLDSARARRRRVKCKQGSRSSVMGADSEVSPCCALGVEVPPWALRLEMRTQPSRAAVRADRPGHRAQVRSCQCHRHCITPTTDAASGQQMRCTARTAHSCASLPALVRGQASRMPAARPLRRTSRQPRAGRVRNRRLPTTWPIGRGGGQQTWSWRSSSSSMASVGQSDRQP